MPVEPNPFVSQFNTALNPAQEAAFQTWMHQLSQATGRDRSEDLQDYDMRGAFLSGAQPAASGHFPDTFKKPNHPTFSVESQYSTAAMPGGVWGQTKEGRDTFTPSGMMQKDTARMGHLKDYFSIVEKDATLLPGKR